MKTFGQYASKLTIGNCGGISSLYFTCNNRVSLLVSMKIVKLTNTVGFKGKQIRQ